EKDEETPAPFGGCNTPYCSLDSATFAVNRFTPAFAPDYLASVLAWEQSGFRMSSPISPSSRVYMDANATTPLLPEVLDAMSPYWMEHFGNASSIHLPGQQARTAVDHARETIAEFFNCHDAEVVFNSGGTEGDNTALFGLLRPGDHLVTTA